MPFFQKFVFSTTSQVLKNWSYHKHNNGEKTLRTFTNCLLGFVTCDNTRKKSPKFFIHWRKCLYFQKFVFSTESYVLKNWSYKDQSNCHDTLRTLTKCRLKFVTLDSTIENRPKRFFTAKITFFFQKFVFWTISQVLKKWSNNFHSNCQKTLGTNINCSRRFVTTDNTMKDQPRTFVTKRKANFWKISCYRPLRSQRRNIINYKKSVKQTLWTLHKCLLTFLMFDKSRKKAQNLFFTGKIAFFFQKKCVFNNLTSPDETIIVLAR